jgi:DNA-binding winged helix-turn-helix (wHTH) protein/tetratricopeptide (TPR) repeat protein
MDTAVAMPLRRIDLAAERPFRVGNASVDPNSRDASFGGQSERLQPQNLKVLIALRRQRGLMVRREELVDQCWDGRIIGDDVINHAISTLRQFAERAGGFEIETVPRAGYRLIETRAVAAKSNGRRAAMAAGAAILLIASGWYFVSGWSSTPGADVPTVAVLPLSGQPGNVQEASEIRASLRYALAEGGYPVALVEDRGASVRPDLLVSGNLQRSGSSIQAIVEVEETAHGVIVYSHRFEADARSVGTLPDQIGASVATNLSRAATLMRLERRHPSDPAIAAQLLNSASQAVDNGDQLQAYEVARHLAPKAPDSAIAQFSLASETGDSLHYLPPEQRAGAVAAGRFAAARLLAIAPDFGDGYALWCSLHSPIQLRQCEDQMRRGVAVDSDADSATSGLGTLLNAVGRANEAIQFDRISLAKDPLNPFKLARMVRLLEETGRSADADRLFRQSIRWWPDHPAIYWNRLVGIEARGDYGELERFAREVDGDKLPLDREAASAVIAGARSGDHAGVAHVCASPGLRWTTQFLCVTALARLGDLDRSFAIANELFPSAQGRNPADAERTWFDQPAAFSIAVLSSPAAAPLRRDRRFLALAEGSGLISYWRSGSPPDFCTVRPEQICGQILRPPAIASASASRPPGRPGGRRT